MLAHAVHTRCNKNDFCDLENVKCELYFDDIDKNIYLRIGLYRQGNENEQTEFRLRRPA